MTEREIQNLLRNMRDEPVPADSLARVRARVEQRINQRSWLSVWKIAAALVMAGCIVAVFFVLKPAKTVPQVSPPEIAQVLPAVEIPVLPERPVILGTRPRRALRPRPVVEGVPVSIRIETPDPDVVILLVN